MGPDLWIGGGARYEEVSPDRGGRRTDEEQKETFDRLVAKIRVRHLSPKTEKTYVGWIRRYLAYHGGRPLRSLGRSEVERFVEHLAQGLGLGADSQNQAASAIAFLYRELWGIDLTGKHALPRAKPPTVLPRYAPIDEIERVLECLRGPARVAAMLMYGSGLRISEADQVRIKDVNLSNLELTVRHGKGAKDRTTVVARGAVAALREQMAAVEAQHVEDLLQGGGWARLPAALHRKSPRAGWELGWQFLFPSKKVTIDPKTGHRGRLPVHVTTFQRALKSAGRASGVPTTIGCHVLRHCFATEMLRRGTDIRMLQRLMGHRDLKTTARYLHVIDRIGLDVTSPLDRLPSVQKALGADPQNE